MDSAEKKVICSVKNADNERVCDVVEVYGARSLEFKSSKERKYRRIRVIDLLRQLRAYKLI